MITRYTIVGPDGGGKSTLAKAISPYAVPGSLITLPFVLALRDSHMERASTCRRLMGRYIGHDSWWQVSRYLFDIRHAPIDRIYEERRENREVWALLTHLQCRHHTDALYILRKAYEQQSGLSVQVHDGFRLPDELLCAKMVMGVQIIGVTDAHENLPEWVDPELCDRVYHPGRGPLMPEITAREWVEDEGIECL